MPQVNVFLLISLCNFEHVGNMWVYWVYYPNVWNKMFQKLEQEGQKGFRRQNLRASYQNIMDTIAPKEIMNRLSVVMFCISIVRYAMQNVDENIA